MHRVLLERKIEIPETFETEVHLTKRIKCCADANDVQDFCGGLAKRI